MFFTSIEFWLFLVIVYVIYYFVDQKSKWIVLLTSSIFFYAFLKLWYLVIIAFLIIIWSFLIGLLLNRYRDARKQRIFLILGIGFALLPLVSLRYLPILSNIDLFQWGLQFYFSSISIVPAFGVSFYTFQVISYMVDVYLGIIESEKNLGYYSLYVLFFPKLLQGPIERGAHLIQQLKNESYFDYQNIRASLLRIGFGLFKKIVIAERLSMFVNPVYNNVYEYHGLSLITATYLYSLQIFFDFSGYCDIAIGVANLFNINLSENFNKPYSARSITEFWRRWHITFSRWILDYIFRPLQMKWRYFHNFGMALALVTTFLISGFWHGASLGFIVWGLIHGILMAIDVFVRPLRSKIYKQYGLKDKSLIKLIEIVITFNLVSFSWVFFRPNTINDAFYIVKNLFNGLYFDLVNVYKNLLDYWNAGQFINMNIFGNDFYEIIKLSFSFIILIILLLLNNQKDGNNKILGLHAIVRWSVYYLMIISIILLGVFGKSQFLYFQF